MASLFGTVTRSPGASRAEVRIPGATSSPDGRFTALYDDEFGRDPGGLLVDLVEDSTGENPEVLRDLPLTELPSKQPGPLMAVIYSGDGGWRDLDKEIGEHLADEGVPVVGADGRRGPASAQVPGAQLRAVRTVRFDLSRGRDHALATAAADARGARGPAP